MLSNFVRMGAILLCVVVAGCTTNANRAKQSSVPQSTIDTTHALAFQADPDFGKGLNSADRSQLSATERQALEYGNDGQKFEWKGSSPIISGVVITFRPFRVGRSNCRRFQHSLKVDEKLSSVDGTACRKTDGDWKLIR